MFNPANCEAKILKEQDRVRKSTLVNSHGQLVFGPTFNLVRHSIAQVAQANEWLSTYYEMDDKGRVKQVKNFTPEDVRWIRNERAICTSDFIYWATRYSFIIDMFGLLSRFNPNVAQMMTLSVFADMEEMEIAILVQVLKARQLGITTLSELIIIWKTMFHARTNALVASSDPDKSATMASKMELCYENQPYWLVPTLTGYHKGELIEFKKQNSGISIQHGTQLSGMARGATPTTFHLSEICDYRNPQKLIDAALLRAVHDSPWVFGVLESTAAGRGNYWHNKWLYNIENWPKRKSRLCPIFLPWFVGTDLYPTRTWIKARPVPVDWVPEDITTAHANRAEAYVRSGQNPLVTRFLGLDWQMPLEQMWFWEATRAEYAANNNLNDFYAELCADDKEAFQSSNISIFDTEVINTYRENIRMPFGVYGLRGPTSEIPPQFQPKERDIDTNSPPIRIKCNWNQSQTSHDYEMVPLCHHGEAGLFDPHGKIIMWEPPEHEELYGLGIDTSQGLGQDRSVIEVVRKGSLTRNDAQVLEFASPYINSFSLWPFALAIGSLYSTRYRGRIQQAKQIIEIAANGENVQHELRKRGWTNFHRWVRYNRKNIKEGQAAGIGWMTVAWSRNMMLDLLLDHINNGWLDINSGWFVDEMSDLELDLDKSKIMAAGGRHDDRIMALGICLFSLHAMDTRNRDGWARRERQVITDVTQFAKFQPGTQASTFLEENPKHPLNAYTFHVINPNETAPEGYDLNFLRRSGATLWTSNMDQE